MTRVSIQGKHEVKTDADFFIRTQLEGVRKESEMKVDFGELSPSLSPRDLDLASIAAGLFECEGLLRNGMIRLEDGLEFALCERGLGTKQLSEALTDLLSFTLHQRPKVEFLAAKEKCANGTGTSDAKLRSVCLFSGGVDSLTGILKVPPNLAPTAGAFVAHSNSMLGCVKNLQTDFLNGKGITVHTVGIQRGRPKLQQMRGFLYLTIGAIVSKMNGTNSIVVSETGQTMFLPPLAALDDVTLTTHPTTVAIAKSVLKVFYGVTFDVFEPFSNLTKAEVVALCDAKDVLSETNSCITSRFAHQRFSHCGMCYGCLVRRMGCLVAGVKDAQYAGDVLTRDVGEPVMKRSRGQTIRTKNLSDMQALLRFSRDVLDDELDEATRLKISTYSREDLYRRAALDAVVALYLLYDKTKQGHNSVVRKFYEECKSDGLVGAEAAEDRISQVREQRFQPDFSVKL